MKKEDSDYKLMEYLDVPVGNIVPILLRRSDKLKSININNPDFQRIKEDLSVFSKSYIKLLNIYSKFETLNENVKEEHGRSIIEKFKIVLKEIKKPLEELEKLANEQKNPEKIKELGNILYSSACALGYCDIEFSTPIYIKYRQLKFVESFHF